MVLRIGVAPPVVPFIHLWPAAGFIHFFGPTCQALANQRALRRGELVIEPVIGQRVAQQHVGETEVARPLFAPLRPTGVDAEMLFRQRTKGRLFTDHTGKGHGDQAIAKVAIGTQSFVGGRDWRQFVFCFLDIGVDRRPDRAVAAGGIGAQLLSHGGIKKEARMAHCDGGTHRLLPR